MGRYKSDIQDSMLKQMEKVNRRSDRKNEDISLEAQLRREEAFNRMTDEQKRAAVPYSDWYRKLEEYMVDRKKVTTNRIFKSIGTKYSLNLRKFHESGDAFSNIIPFIEEKTSYFSNL